MKKTSVLLNIVSGSAIAFLLTLLGIALSALLVKSTALSENTLSFVFVAIKLASIAPGVMFTCFRLRKKGVFCGAAAAFIYKLLCSAFSLMFGQTDTLPAMALDALLTCTAGAICGIIAVNIFTAER